MKAAAKTRFLAWVAFAIVLLSSVPAWAHKPSDAYLVLADRGAAVDVRLDLALRDIDHALGLDDDGNGEITWAEVKRHDAQLQAYAASRLHLSNGTLPCALAPGATPLAVADHSDGSYAVLSLTAPCPASPQLTVDYEIFFDADPQHRGIARVEGAGQSQAIIFAASARTQTFERTAGGPGHVGAQLWSAIRDGVRHIFEGIDHLLFLIALLLPAVLRREGREWKPVPAFRPALVEVLKIVTAFTLAHSITLSLSALGILRLPSRFVESAIAASVIVAAVNNLWPLLKDDRWQAAFALGLLHGFGFSATLMDAGLPRDNLVVTLFGFNLGVEIGQAAVVAVFLPLAFSIRKTRAYRVAGMYAGSALIAAVACVWFVERAFAMKIF